MAAILVLRDESPTGELFHELQLEFESDVVSVREIIRSRVYQEVSDFNAGVGKSFRGLVQPQGSTVVKDGYLLRERRALDWREQFARAVEAFESGRIIVIAGERQVDTLDEQVRLGEGAQVSFLRLVPLVGG